MKNILALFLSFFWSQVIYAQTFPINRQIKGIELPSDIVYNVVQDPEGKIWFNTALGIFYSDSFFTYPIPDSIQNNLSKKVRLFTDKNGVLWLYNRVGDPKVYNYFNGHWSELTLPKELEGKSQIYFEFDVVNKKEGDFNFLVLENEMFFSNKDGVWQRLDIKHKDFGPYQSFFDTGEKVILLFDKKSLEFNGTDFYPFEMSGIETPNQVVQISFDPNSERYFFLGNDFFASGINVDEIEKIHFRDFIKSSYILETYNGLHIFQGKVFFYYDSQLYQYSVEEDKVIEISSYDELRSHNIYCTLIDNEGILWIGTHRGLVNINSLKFLKYGSPMLLDDEVTAIIRIASEEYLLGFNNGLQLWSKGKVRTLYSDESLKGLPEYRITNFVQDKNGVVWFSANTLGIGRYEPKNNSLVLTKNPNEKFVNSVHISGDSLFIVSSVKLYLSSIKNTGLDHFKNEISSEIFGKVGQRSVFIRKIGKLSDNRMVFMQGGNPVADKDKVLETEDFILVIGYDFLETEDHLLFATETGLKSYNSGRMDFFHIGGEIIQRPVFGLLKDSSGIIWAGTDKGVYKIDQGNNRQYDVSSGLSGSETNRAALLEAENGNIFIGTSKGLSVFNPREEYNLTRLPKTDIGRIRLVDFPNRKIDIRKIPFSNNSVEIDYKAITFLQDAKLKVYYKLQGLHNDWQVIDNPRSNSLTFNNLRPGKYKLLLKATIDGVTETEEISSDEFKVLKPIYLQFWFLTLFSLSLFGIGFLIKSLTAQTKRAGFLRIQIDEKTKEAQSSEDQFRNVWESSSEGLMLATDEGKIITVNEAFSKLVGIPVQELESNNVTYLFSDPDFFQYEKERLEELYKDGKVQNINLEIRMPFKSGLKEIDYYASELKSKIEGKTVYLSVFRDNSEKKKYEAGLKAAKEKAEEANRMKTSFLSNMSHEIRTPLNGILGTTENIMQQRPNDKELISQLEIIQESGERLLHTINSILDISKIEANKMEVKLSEVNINDFMAKIILPLKSLAIKKGVLISVKYHTHPFIGYLDERYFEMIVNNIVGNAIKYTNKGLVTIKIGKNNQKLELEVIDQGIGMSQEFLEKIFNPFEQESHGYGRNYEGTGLGLAITKNLVTIMKGEIMVESEKDKGTRVVINLPLGKN
ncbi:ATP-binding protein [Shivajiella indica]|uniref:histidine kinase n=1 Tax=Shivajiella indica TaxID=872115 RepID=A0ABW5B7T8_9BACT